MSKLVLISHGQLCEELKKSAEMIMGPQDDIATVALLPNEGPEDFQAKFKAAVEGQDDVSSLPTLKAARRITSQPVSWLKAASSTCILA